MTATLAPVERTNWALPAWNSTLDRNDVPSAWLYGQDHLWATSHLVSSPGEVFPPPSPTPPHPPHPPLPSPPLHTFGMLDLQLDMNLKREGSGA